MRKIILSVLGSALLVATSVQFAAAAEHHRGHRADRAPVSEPFRNANDAYGWRTPSDDSGASRYYGGAISAPAGRN